MTTLGAAGERLAQQYLEEQGLRIHETNARVGYGELDLVMTDPKTNELVFVEVRTRGGTRFGAPEESFTASKRSALRRSILGYVTRTGWTGQYRLDLVGIIMSPNGLPEITHIPHIVLA